MKRILSYLFVSIITIGMQAQQVVVEKTDGTKSTYPVETFQKAAFVSNGAAQDYMIVKTTSGDKTEIPVNQVKSVIIKNISNGHEYVDLGLSVKWATCNVGASKPEEYGDYFAWGETTPQSNNRYYWDSYKLCKGSYNTITKYCTNSSYGTVDNKTTLEPADDAARANWGGSWRMPTKLEFDELKTKCTWVWTTQNGVKGYKVMSKTNGNSIFLPAAGSRLVAPLDDVGTQGKYWSSSLSTNNSYSAYSLFFYWNEAYSSDNSHRVDGLSIRAVYP